MDFTAVFPLDKSVSIVESVSEFLAKPDLPLTNRLNTLLKQGEFLKVIDFQFDYSSNFSLRDFQYARQIQALVSKQDWLDLGINTEEVAFRKFLESEELCSITNERFRSVVSADESADVSSVIYLASRKICQILGDVPNYDELNFSFGPGATTSVTKARSHPRVKLEAKLACSYSLLPHAEEFLAEFPGWLQAHSNDSTVELHVTHGKLQFVPKSSKTQRSIVVEPTLNGFGQQGIGKHLKNRLKLFGVDLRDQTRNQNLAREGSIEDNLSTIDLASASDTISYGLVLHLLPPDWFDFLDRFRTGTVEYNGNVYKLQKFSSMGNSYTFELESLIFYSLSHAVCTHLGLSTKKVSVFGDDIIIPSEATLLLKEVLSYCGFVVNSTKSFVDGPFRESCGADFLFGNDIRPFYLKDQISVRVLFIFHNWCIRNCEPELAQFILQYIPQSFCVYGPNGFGDGHLIGSYQLRTSRKLKRLGYEGGFFDTFVTNPRRIVLPELSDWVYPVYCIYVREGAIEDSAPPRHDIVPGATRYHRISIYTLKRSVF